MWHVLPVVKLAEIYLGKKKLAVVSLLRQLTSVHKPCKQTCHFKHHVKLEAISSSGHNFNSCSTSFKFLTSGLRSNVRFASELATLPVRLSLVVLL